MPIYEYECSKCGKIEEVFQKFSNKPLVKCKHCSGKLHKLISHSSFHLKGTGWYVTDYANKSKPDSAAPKKTDHSKASDSPKSSTKKNATKAAPDSSASQRAPGRFKAIFEKLLKKPKKLGQYLFTIKKVCLLFKKIQHNKFQILKIFSFINIRLAGREVTSQLQKQKKGSALLW